METKTPRINYSRSRADVNSIRKNYSIFENASKRAAVSAAVSPGEPM